MFVRFDPITFELRCSALALPSQPWHISINYLISFISKAAAVEMNWNSQQLLQSCWFSPQWCSFIKRIISNFLGALNQKTATQLGMRAGQCSQWQTYCQKAGEVLRASFSHLWTAVIWFPALHGAGWSLLYWERSDGRVSMQLGSSLKQAATHSVLGRFGQSQPSLAWNSPAVRQSGGVPTLESLLPLMVRRTRSGRCAGQGPERSTSHVRKANTCLKPSPEL